MTREEFLAFDTSKFYEPGCEQDRDLMSFFTGLFITAMIDTDAKYNKAKKNNQKTIEENDFQLWFSSKKASATEFFKSTCPQGPFKHEEFLKNYEIYLKNFVRAYHNQVAEITENNDNYYFFERYKKDILGKVFYKYPNKDDLIGVNPCTLFIEKEGFCDLRYIISFSFKNNDTSSTLIEKSYDDSMADCRDSFFDSTVRLIDNFEEQSNAEQNYRIKK